MDAVLNLALKTNIMLYLTLKTYIMLN